MIEQSLFDYIEGGEQYKPIKSNDWKWSFSDYPKEKNGLKVFSCFACGGGSTMGYKLAGCEVLGCCEIDKKMNDVYIANHHPKYNFLMDIRDFNKIPNEELPPELFALDVLDGSPPCTTFSMAGQREKTWGKEKKFREGQKKQTLDDLAFVFIETAKKLMPKVVIMENVEGLINGSAWSYVQKIYMKFDLSGYRVLHYLLKGENMGIPQMRHRVFFIAIRKDIDFDMDKLNMCFNYERIVYGNFKSGKGEKINPKSKNYYYLSHSNENDKDLTDVVMRLEKRCSLFSYAILNDNKMFVTITAGGSCPPMRRIEMEYCSIDDIIHAQTFPEDYDFIKKTMHNVRYICGMSVPPVMIKRIMQRLIEQGLFDYKLLTKQID